MGISIDRALRIQTKAREKISYFLLNARTFYYTWEWITAQMTELMSSPDLQKAPVRVRSYLRGWYEARRDSLYQHTTWMLWCDGRLMTSKEVDQLTAKEKLEGQDKSPTYVSPWQRIQSDKSRHVWLDTHGQPLPDKPIDARWRTAT